MRMVTLFSRRFPVPGTEVHVINIFTILQVFTIVDIEPADGICLAAINREGHLFFLSVKSRNGHCLTVLVGGVCKVCGGGLRGDVNHIVVHVRTPIRQRIAFERECLQFARLVELFHLRRDSISHVVHAFAVGRSDDGCPATNTTVVEDNRLLRVVLLNVGNLEALHAIRQVDDVVTGNRCERAGLGLISSGHVAVFYALNSVCTLRLGNIVADGVETRVAVLRLHRDFGHAGNGSFHVVDALCRLRLLKSNVIRFAGSERHFHDELRRVHVTSDIVDREAAQFGVSRFLFGEGDGVFRLGAILCNDLNLGHAVRTAEPSGDGLVLQLRNREYIRYHFCLFRQRNAVVEAIRAEAIEALAVDEDVRQEGVGTLFTRVRNYIGVRAAILGCHQNTLFLVAGVVAKDGLSGFAGSLQSRQRHTFVNHQSIVREGVGVEGDSITGYLQVLERSVSVRENIEGNGVCLFGAILGRNGNSPFAFCHLTEEDNFCVVSSDVGHFGIVAAGSQVTRVVQLIGFEIRHCLTVDEYGFQRFIAEQMAAEGNAVGCFVAECVSHVEPSHGVFPEDVHRLAFITFDISNGRQRAFVGSSIVLFRRIESGYRFVVDSYHRESRRSRSNGHELNRIGIGCSLLGLHIDVRSTCTIRSGDGHLLTGCFVHRDSRTFLRSQVFLVVG